MSGFHSTMVIFSSSLKHNQTLTLMLRDSALGPMDLIQCTSNTHIQQRKILCVCLYVCVCLEVSTLKRGQSYI